jgi:hypothetical protein
MGIKVENMSNLMGVGISRPFYRSNKRGKKVNNVNAKSTKTLIGNQKLIEEL